VLVTGFEVTIRQRSDLRAPFMLAGRLTINLAPSGEFTGQLTPGQDPEGNLAPGVLFRATDDGLRPVPDGPQSLEAAGSIQNHTFNLMIKLPGEEKYVYGAGTSLANLSELPGGSIDKPIAGSAVGPEPGDSGDWAVICTVFCVVINGQRQCFRIC